MFKNAHNINSGKIFRSRRAPLIVRTFRFAVTKSKLDYRLNVRNGAVYVVNQRFRAQYRKHKSVPWVARKGNGNSECEIYVTAAEFRRAGTTRVRYTKSFREIHCDNGKHFAFVS